MRQKILFSAFRSAEARPLLQVKRATLLLALFCLAVSGCSSLAPVKVQPAADYTLSHVAAGKPTHRKSRATLFVSSTTARPGYQTARMIYTEKPHELKSFVLNRWVAPPAYLLTGLIVQSLRNQHYFHAVVTGPFTGLSNYRLDTQLIRLEQDFSTVPSRLHMVLDAQLVSNANNKVIASRQFSATIKAPLDTPYGGVIATNHALEKILPQLVRFCIRNAGKPTAR